MKVFVTGVNGQLGHDVINELNKQGIEAIGSDITEEYAGLEGKELEEKSNIKGFEFCHRTRFMMTAKNKATALKIVKSILQSVYHPFIRG